MSRKNMAILFGPGVFILILTVIYITGTPGSISWGKNANSEAAAVTENREIKYFNGQSEETISVLIMTDSKGERYLSSVNGQNPLIPSPDHKKYIYSDRFLNIFLLDPDNLEMKQVNSTIGRPEAQKKFAQLGGYLYWASNPQWGQDSNTVLFASNRTSNSKFKTSYWKLDLSTATEKMLYESDASAGPILGVTYDNKIVIQEGPITEAGSQQVTKTVDIKTKEVKEIFSGHFVGNLISNGAKLVYYDATPVTKLWTLDLVNGQVDMLFEAPSGYFIATPPTPATSSPDNNYVAIPLGNTGGNWNTIAIVKNDSSVELRQIPDGYTLNSSPVNWISNTSFSIEIYPGVGNKGASPLVWQIDL